MKPLHIALGLGGAFLLLHGKKKGGANLENASALGTATAAQDAISEASNSNEMKLQTEAAEVEILEDHLVAPAVKGAPYMFTAEKAPTPTEFAMLYSISPLVAARSVPSTDLRRHLSTQIASDKRLSLIANRTLNNSQKIAMGLQLMTPQKTRMFAADCLELALPVFEKEFPGNKAAAKLIEGIRLFSAKAPGMGSAQLSALMMDVVAVCQTKANVKAVSSFMTASICASITKENFGKLAITDAPQVKRLMLDCLQKTKDIAIELRKNAAGNAAAAEVRKDGKALKRTAEGFLPKTGPMAAENERLMRSMEEHISRAEKMAVRDTEQSILQRSLKQMVKP